MEETWDRLPKEVVLLPLVYLPVLDLSHLGLTCRFFYQAIQQNALWKLLFRRQFPSHYPNRDFKDYRFQYAKKTFTDLRQQVYRQWNSNHQVRLNSLLDQRKPLSRQITELNKRKSKVMLFERRFNHVKHLISSKRADHVHPLSKKVI